MFWKNTKKHLPSGKIDLSQATFIIPIRLESPDRIRNLRTSLSYLLGVMKTNILIKECDNEPQFEAQVLPFIEKIRANSQSNLSYVFEHATGPAFHRQRLLNDMILQTTSPVVVNYDCDVLLPLSSYKKAYELIINGKADLVYPYGDGMYQSQVFANDALTEAFLSSGFDLETFKGHMNKKTAKYGFCQFFDRKVYIEGGLENENFVSYAPEDFERYYRYKKLGYKVKRIKDTLYHLEHSRSINSSTSNPHMAANNAEWEKIQRFNRKELWQYISNQPYYKKRMMEIAKDN